MNLNKEWEDKISSTYRDDPQSAAAAYIFASEMQEAVLKVLDEYMIVPEALKDLIKNVKPNE